MMIVLVPMKNVTQLIKYVGLHAQRIISAALGVNCVILLKNYVSLVRKRELKKKNLMARNYLACDPTVLIFGVEHHCVWPGYKCNTDWNICGKECTKNGDCKRGEYCDPWMGVCVQGKIQILICFLIIISHITFIAFRL